MFTKLLWLPASVDVLLPVILALVEVFFFSIDGSEHLVCHVMSCRSFSIKPRERQYWCSVTVVLSIKPKSGYGEAGSPAASFFSDPLVILKGCTAITCLWWWYGDFCERNFFGGSVCMHHLKNGKEWLLILCQLQISSGCVAIGCKEMIPKNRPHHPRARTRGQTSKTWMTAACPLKLCKVVSWPSERHRVSKNPEVFECSWEMSLRNGPTNMKRAQLASTCRHHCGLVSHPRYRW